MKDHHLPFKIVKKWPEVLDSFTSSDPYGEIPSIYFKRSDIFHRGLECQLEDSKSIELFFNELTFNIIYSFYPCELDLAIRLAAIHLRINCGLQAPDKATFKKIVGCSRPQHLSSAKSDRAWRSSVIDSAASIPTQQDTSQLRNMYLRLGRNLKHYGVTFFYGHIEPEVKGTIRRIQMDILVRVGVNLNGIHVIKDASNEIMLSLPFSKLEYNSYESTDENPDASFLIEWDADIEGMADAASTGDREKSRLVIWTAQAEM